jgi:hypothetical protein
VLAPAGVFLARFAKRVPPSSGPRAFWFVSHYMVQSAALAAAAAGLGLARLLVTGRPVWLLDEPTVSLDAASVALFADVVRAHLARGGSALIATHVDLGLDEAALLDLTAFRAQSRKPDGAFDGAFA